MSAFAERCQKTLLFLEDPDVSAFEGVVHAYLWVMYECAIRRRNKATQKANKYAKILNANLDVVEFRKQMKNANI